MSRPARPPMLAPFAIRGFRFQWAADLATSWAFEMETLILGWYILVQTGSVLLLTLFASLQFLGTLVAPVFGLAGDRFGHRIVLSLMRGTFALLAALLAVMTVTGALSPARVLVLAGLAGLVRPSDVGMRSVLIGETVPGDRLMGAISLSRLTTDTARVAGALAGAGVVAALGMASAYGAIVLLYASSALFTLRVVPQGGPAGSVLRAAPASPWRDLFDAARAVWEAPAQLAAMLMAFLMNLMAYPFTLGLLPYVAREVYGAAETGLGYLMAATGVGAIGASLVLSWMGPMVRPARMMIGFGLLWHALIVVFGHVGDMRVGLVLLVLIGMCTGLCLLPMSVLLLRGAAPSLRGRIMGMRTLAVYGLPIGLLVSGPLIQHVGFAATATLYGVSGLAATLLVLLRWRAHLWPAEAAGNRG